MVKQRPLNLEKQKKLMMALITYGFKKEQQNTIKYYLHISIFVVFAIRVFTCF